MRRENPRARVLATDLSPRMVELAACAGVVAQVADAQRLPFGDGSFDVVAAMWMLYHVPDLDAALAEARRVLRPGGLLVAVTNGDEHTGDLRRAAGGGGPGQRLQPRERGSRAGPALRVRRARGHRHRAEFPDHAAAAAYLRTFDDGLADALPYREGPWTAQGATTVFLAR